jgi:hypothetical protein
MDTNKQTKQEKMDAIDAKDKIDSLGDMEQRIKECDEWIDTFILLL